jgi:putative RecB family exonuclease
MSPTKLNTYLTCAKQYYFAYVARLPRYARSYFSFGSSIHGALQDFHAAGGTATQPVETLLGNLEQSWVTAGYTTPEEQQIRFDLGQELLSNYYKAEEVRASETLFVEKTLSIPLPGFVLAGRLDRIDRRPDGLLEIVDYKSGSYLPSPEELKDDLAISIYQLLAARHFQSMPVFGTIYNLRANEGVSIVRGEDELKAVEDHVGDVFRILSSDTEFKPNPGWECKHCDFIRYCPEGRSGGH